MTPTRRRAERKSTSITEDKNKRFMELLAESGDILCVGWKSSDYGMKQKQFRADTVIGDKTAELASEHDVYFTPVPQARRDQAAGQTQFRAESIAQPGRVVYADCDNGLTEDQRAFLEQLDATLVRSGSLTGDGRPKYHVYVWLNRKIDPRQIRLLNMQLAKRLDGDRKYDTAAYLRVPGTFNHKTSPPRPVEIEYLSAARHVAAELAEKLDFSLPPAEELGRLSDGRAASYPEVLKFIEDYSELQDERSDKRIKRYLKEFANDHRLGDSRHNSILSATAWALREASEGLVNAQDAVDALLKAFKYACQEDKGRPVEDEYEAIVAWALGKVQADKAEIEAKKAEKAENIRSKFITLDELLEMEDPEWLIDGVLTLDTLARVNGDSGIGKSFVVLDMAAHIALGLEWHGHEVKQGTVIHLIAEGARGHKKRVQAWMKHHDKRLDKHYVMYPEAVQVAEDEAWSAFAEECIARKPLLIILDTQARVTLGIDENGNTDMGPIAEKLEDLRKATEACVLLVHHTGHGMERARGASTMTAVMNTEFLLKRGKEDRVLTLTNTKEKDEADGGNIRFAPLVVHVGEDKKGRAITSLVLQLDAGQNAKISLKAVTVNRVREDLLKFIDENPGCNNGEILKAVKGKTETIAAERGQLAKDGLIENRGTKGRPLWHRTNVKETLF